MYIINRLYFTIKCSYFAIINTINHDGIEHAGYMAFLSIVSLFPFIIFLIALASAFGDTSIGTDFVRIIYDSLPNKISIAIEPRIKEIISGPPEGLMTLAIFGAIWTASSSVEGIRTILNKIYLANSPPAYIRRRILSIIQFLLITALIMFTMLVLVFIPNLFTKITSIELNEINNNLKELPVIWNFFRYFLLKIILFFVVTIIYYIIPNLKLSLKSVMPGSLFVVILWSFAGNILSIYLNNFRQVSIIYGSLGGIIAILLFFYIMNLILIYGAEFNNLFCKCEKSVDKY